MKKPLIKPPTTIHTDLSSQILDSLEDYAVFTTDNRGLVTTWNAGAKKLLGYSEKKVIGKSADIFFTPEDLRKSASKKELHTALTKGNALDERWHVRKDSSKFWGSGLVFPLKDTSGRNIGFTKIMRDLTERRWGMNILKQSEERYRAFIQNSTEGIWRFEVDRPVKITLPIKKQINAFYEYAYLAECNEVVAKMYGFKKPENITGMRLDTFLIKENKQNIDYLTAFINAEYKLSEVESYEKDKDGNDKFFLNNLVGIVENGYLIRAWGTQRDITEQKKAETSFKQLAEIVQYSEDAIVSRSFDGKTLSWNKGAEKMFGYSASEMIGRDATITIPENIRGEAEIISERIKNGKQIDHFETTRVKRDGTEFDVSLSVSAIKDVVGNISGISAIARDITGAKKLQQQKDEFIGIASHELKTPVTSIKAYAQVIQKRFEKKGDKDSVKLLKKMETQLNKLTDLISDLLDVTKIESGKLEFHTGHYDFNELVEEVVEEIQHTTDHHIISIDKKVKKSVYGDRDRIGQVLTNLLSNAIKYSPNAKKIFVTASSNNGSITLCVQDFGVGIPKNRQSLVFERFFRVSGPDSTSFPGMGLGLYISSEIIKRQGGRIWVESRRGYGSTFCFTIPYTSKSSSKKI